MKKRLLSLFLCVMMLLTLVPVTALAQDVGGADDQAAAQEAVQENVEDTAEDAVPAEPVKPTEAEGPVVLPREEAALDEPAEEDIATQDETGDDQATIVSIKCAEETDADGYVHVMEGSDMYMWQEKGEWILNVNDGAVRRLKLTVEYIPAGSTEQKTVTGEAWKIRNATGMEVSYTGDHTCNEDSGMYTPWKSGDTYEVKVMLGGEDVTIKLKVDDNLVTSVAADNSEAIELVKGENGGYGTTTDPDTGEEVREWYYSLNSNADATFTVTLRDGTELSGTSDEINRQINASDELSAYGIWFDYSAGDTSVWKPGQEYTVWYGMNCVGVKKTVTISDAPSFKSITPNFTDPIELLEGVDGYWIEGNDTFHYDWTRGDPEPTFTVTLTEDGVRRYGVKTCEGSYNKIRDQFSGVYMETTNGKTMDEWPVSDEPYSFDVKLGTVSCPVEVKVVENVVKTIQAVVDGPIEVQYGTDAHFWIDGEAKEHWKYYYYLQPSELQYSLTINGEKEPFTYDELSVRFKDVPGMYDTSQQMADGRWEIGSTHDVQMYFRGVVFNVPVKVVAPEHTVEKLEYVGRPLIMAQGLHNRDSEWFDLNTLYDYFRVRVTYDDGQQETMAQYEMNELFGAWPDITSNQVDEPWQAGQENCMFYVQLCGQLLKIPVTVIENPVADLSPVDTITLSDEDRYERNGDSYYYVTRPAGNLKLTLTEAGAAIYNDGKTEFTGTLDVIFKLLNRSADDNRITSDQSADNLWTPSDGKTHTITVDLGTTFEIPVTVLGMSYYFEKLELKNANYVVKLKEGGDATSCLNGEFKYDVTNGCWSEVALTLTDAGMKHFNQTKKVFEGDEIPQTFDYMVRQVGDNVQWNEDGVTGTATLGLATGIFGKPAADSPTCTVNVELVKNEVAKVECINAPVTLYEDIDSTWENLDSGFVECYVLTRALYSESAQFKVTLTDGETFTGGGKTIWNKLGFYPLADSAALYAQKEQPWSPNDGIEHVFTVYVGTASCEVPVTFGTATDIEINEENFPDEAFRNYLLYNHSYDGVTVKMETVTSIDCSGWGITSLKGIELFQELVILDCGANLLKELDISQNSKLRELNCYDNQMTTLNVSKNSALIQLFCGNNPLGKLDVSKNAELEVLNCYNDQLTALDVSKNTNLKELYCGGNALETLDVSKNLELTGLYCYSNKLKTLDVTNNAKLLNLDCDDNPLGKLDVSKNSALQSLYCNGCQLNALDVSNNVALKELVCHFNNLTTLDISKNTALLEVGCSGNKLTSVNASKCEKLEVLYCANNQSTEKLTVHVAKLEGLNLSTTGAQGDVQIIVNGTVPAEKPVAGTLNADGMRLTLSQNGEVKYVTMVVGDQYRFDAVANGTYTLTAEDYSYYDYIPRSTTVTVTDGTITGMENFKIAMRGDMNLDGTIDVYDLQLLYECVSEITEVTDEYVMAVADVNETGSVDIIDVQLLYAILTGSSGIDSAKTG